MNDRRREIFTDLLEGCYILKVRNSKGVPQWKLYTGNMSPRSWVKESDYRSLEIHLIEHRSKPGRMELSRRSIRGLHASTTLKKMYRQHMKKVYAQNLKGLKDK